MEGVADPGLRRRARTAAASTSTRTSSTTTTARASSRTRPTRAAPATLFSKPNGTYTYPTDAAYANNAADFVELRVRPLASATAFRVTLNTLKDPSLRGVLDRDRRHARRAAPVPARRERERARRAVPHRAPGRVTAWSPSSRTPPAARPSRARADRRARHHPPPDRGARAARRLEPDRHRSCAWRPAWACGTRPTAATCCRSPPPTPRTPAGGHGGQPAGVLQRRLPLRRADAADRRPRRHRAEPRLVARPRPGRGARRRRHQRASTPTSTSASSRRTRATRAACRRAGPIDRILASHFETGAGRRLLRRPASPATPAPARAPYQGRLQPYAIYVPRKPLPRRAATA